MSFFRVWLVVIVVLFLSGLFYFSESFISVASANGAEVKDSGAADIGSSFTLTNQDGKKVSDKDFHGKLQLVYFGFTTCPAVCPVDMAMITEALKKLGKNAEKVAPIFISIDPKTDDSKQLKKFLKNYYPTFTGLTGPQKEIDKIQKGYKVYAKESSEKGVFNHSSHIYLMDKTGKYITHFSPGTDAKAVAAGIEDAVKKNQ